MESIYGDRLHREEYVQKIVDVIKLCSGNNMPRTFSIEAEWGRGKTWLIEKVEASLKGIDISKPNPQKPSNKELNQYLIIHYNAWEIDYYDEPLLAMLIKIIDTLNARFRIENLANEVAYKVIREIMDVLASELSSISKRVFGFDVVDIGKRVKKNIKQLTKTGKIELATSNEYSTIEVDIEKIVSTLNKLSKDYPIIFVADELDRCMPPFAIKTLERVHHIFSKVHRCVTVLVFNRGQLLRSIDHAYGEGTAEHYLEKIIDFRIFLNEGNLNMNEIDSALEEFSSMFQSRNSSGALLEPAKEIVLIIGPREFEHAIRRAILIHKLIQVDTKPFPIDCMTAEILLQIKNSVDQFESRPSNSSPFNGDVPETKEGRIMKEIMEAYRKTNNLIAIVFETVLTSYDVKYEGNASEEKLFKEIKAYYMKYRVLYNVITHE